jgi:hypothetical protein
MTAEELVMRRDTYREFRLREREHLDAERQLLHRRRAYAWARLNELRQLHVVEPGAVEASAMRAAEKEFTTAEHALSDCVGKLREVQDELELLTPISESIRGYLKRKSPPPPSEVPASRAERIRPLSLKDRVWFAAKVLTQRRQD